MTKQLFWSWQYRLMSLALLALLVSCSDDATPQVDGGPDIKVADATPNPPPTCNHKPWSKGTKAFTENKSWKLDGVSATRLSVADIDGDGWPDLALRHEFKGWVLRNTGKGSFEEVTASAKLFIPRPGAGKRQIRPVSFGDVDNDGDLDAYTGSKSLTGGTSELMINDGKGVFSFGSASSPLRNVGRTENPAGGAFIDYNLDGKLDLWVPHNGTAATAAETAYQDRLYAGNGKGGFTEVTSNAGLTTLAWNSIADLNAGKSHSRAWGALACDLNNDGMPELLTPSYGRSPNHLWQAHKNGNAVTYTNRSVVSGYAYDDNQNWTDNHFAQCYCKANPTAAECAEVAAPKADCTAPNWNHNQDREAYRLGGNSGSTSCADLNNDGFMDLVTGEIKHYWAGENADSSQVLLNDGKGDVTFTRLDDKQIGLSIAHTNKWWDEGHMTQVVFDFDNDGLLDIYQGDSDYVYCRGRLYHQVKGETLKFEEVDFKTDGIDHNRSQGVVAADFDHDGDLDLIVGHSRTNCGSLGQCYATNAPRFFENVIGNKNAWVQLKLVGDGQSANRAAIGAHVTLDACGMTQTRQVNGGYGHYGAQDDMVLHFGAGDATSVKVTIIWPDAKRTKQTFSVATKQRYTVEMGKAPVEGF